MPARSSSGAAPAVRGFDTLVVLAALAAIAVGFAAWQRHGGPDWQPVSVLGLVATPLLLRYSPPISVGSVDGYPHVLGLAAAVLFASETGSGTVFPLWGLLVLAAYVAFRGGLRGFVRGADAVVAGAALDLVAGAVDWPLEPFVRVAAGLAAYLLVDAGAFWVRRRLSGQDTPAGTLDRRASLIAVAALAYGSLFVAALHGSYAERSTSYTAEVAVLGVGLLVAGLVSVSTLGRLSRGVVVLSEAATSLPWPSDDNDHLVARFARRAVASASAEIVPGEGPSGTLSAPVDAVRHLVLRRSRGDLRFSPADRQLLEAIAAMAGVSRSVDLREAGLRLQSITDDVTGLWTISMFGDLAAEAAMEREHGEVLAVLLLEVDDFQAVNERLGHNGADDVLREIARRLQEAAPSTATAARWAGVTFALLLREPQRADIEVDVQTVVDALTAPLETEHETLELDVSVGIALSTDPADVLADTMKLAEQRLQEAHRTTRAVVSGDEPEPAAVVEVSSATLLFRPVLDARSGALWGCEVVVPGANDDPGATAARSSAARQHELDARTRSVGQAAAEAMALLQQRVEQPLALSMDLELEQLRTGTPVFEELHDQLRTRGAGLVLELSERRYRRWTEQHDAIAQRLKDHGLRIAIDDFGTGFAAFSLLSSWGWDLVKIDRSLVTADDEQSRLLFNNVVRTLRELRLTAGADGVETGQQLFLARRAGISLVQGDLVCEALPMAELLDRVGPEGDALAVTLQAGAGPVAPPRA